MKDCFNKALYGHGGKVQTTLECLKNDVNVHLLIWQNAHNTLLSEKD